MSYLIDTNIISEIRKGQRCAPRVAAWYASIDDADLYLSVLVTGEVRKGVERARATDTAKAKSLEAWLAEVGRAFGDRILSVDREVAEEWGRMSAVRSLPVIDGLLAATAKVHGLTLVTRNAKDVEGSGASIFNPFGAD